ncbi:hypothetical protein N7517_006629 [Penicillium concentricum]|uniref:Uncharacterized protein n=1 Tax=Penicillium concentricum TaxID=293559 RepID=A0A9W9SEE3_9EURO|nr:uncharacterized protein N7517_006629 [Penicillium concentricum]KAJ5374623.1 hypothetical protein N7517_006629 [Penicillium concentricum]
MSIRYTRREWKDRLNTQARKHSPRSYNPIRNRAGATQSSPRLDCPSVFVHSPGTESSNTTAHQYHLKTHVIQYAKFHVNYIKLFRTRTAHDKEEDS